MIFLTWFEAVVREAVRRRVEELLPPPVRIVRFRWKNPRITELDAPIEDCLMNQVFTTTQPADVIHGYKITGQVYTDGVGDPVAVDVSGIVLSSSDESVVPRSNIRANADGSVDFKPLNSAPAGATVRFSGSVVETGTEDDWHVDYTVGADRVFSSMAAASIAELTESMFPPAPVPEPVPEPAPEPAPEAPV